jgi:peptide/nickel transport system substrate-binding protein
VELRENGSVYRLQRFRPQGEPVKPSDFIDLVPFNAETSDEGDPFALFTKGKLDILIDGWKSRIPREQLPWIRRQPGLHVQEAPGSVLHYVSFRLDGPTADRNLRLHVAKALNRSELIEKVESGYADPTYAWAAPTVKTWPQLQSPPPGAPLPQLNQPLRLLGYQNHFRPREKQWCEAMVAQLTKAGIPVVCSYLAGDDYKKAVAAGEYDLRTEITWGLPYDPDMSLKSRFLPATFKRPSGAGNRYFGVDPRSEELARKIAATPDEKDRLPLYEQMQKLLSEEALVAPLFVPRRISVIRGRDVRLPFDHDVYRDAISALTDQP